MSLIESIKSKVKNYENQVFTELYGNNKAVLKTQSERYLRVLNEFCSKFNAVNPLFFNSPGRTEIGGNHTDHNFGRVLAGAVNIDNIAVVESNNSNTVVIQSAGYPDAVIDLSITEIIEEEKFTSKALVRGISARLKELGYKTGGFNAVIDGEVPKGSGLSSSASFEVLIGEIFNQLFNNGTITPIVNAMIGQYAENNYFGKPCGLMDQTACAVGGLVSIDFKVPGKPVVKKVNFDFLATGYSLIITDTGGNHADLNDEYASLPVEMKLVAKKLGAEVLRELSTEQIIEAIPLLRETTGDRAILRSLHFQGDNARVVKQVESLENNDFRTFLNYVIESGYSSFMYNQNIFPVHNVKEQGLSLALALSELVLKNHGAWRVHGGGFAGTIQAFVPGFLIDKYISTLEHVYGKNSCHKLFIRQQGAVKLHF
ncbi:MAG TPA: galactokinase [Bacteroidales bacterium]|nr:galactokinase [Bacteroidales bacterium]